MKPKRSYKNIYNLQSLLKFFYYSTIILTFIGLILILAILVLPETVITFEQGVREWFYTVNLPTGIGSINMTLQSSIPSSRLPFGPIEMINVNAAIIIDSLVNTILLIVLVNLGLKKLINLTSDTLNNESPFQLKHVMSLRKFSFIIILYATLGNFFSCLLYRIFVTDITSIPINFMWSGIFIGILGYIFSDITEYGLFLQDEYDTTL